MAESTFGIGFSLPTSSASCLKLEQEPWGEDVGETTKMQGIVGIAAAINGSQWPEVRCGGLNGIFTAIVYAYPCTTDLSFNLKVSHGKVVSHKAFTVYRDEIIQCSLRKSVTTDYPVRNTVTLAWLGACRDNLGNVTSRPTVEVVGDTIYFSKGVYASLRVKYTVYRHEYKIEISKRLQAFENKYQSVAYAVWEGGLTWIDIEAPANFEQFDGDCGNGAFYDSDGDGSGLQDGYNDGQLSQTDICNPDYNKLPVAVEADRKIDIEYCSQAVLSDKVTETVDWESEKGECDE